ncbi:MAG: aldo/keto reductase [Terrimicrobiaceae bacterium]
MKIALGTVQFGMAYGVANASGRVPAGEVEKILACASLRGIDTLDTAVGYGESETVLGAFPLGSWKVISKIGTAPEGCQDIPAWVNAQVEGSLSRLRIPSLDALLLHTSHELLGSRGEDVYAALGEVKAQGLAKKIGISIYSPAELDELAGRYPLDIVQAPVNVFDRRLAATGWMEKLALNNIELHARSVFLQGLLLMSPSSRPEKFQRWGGLWDAWDNWLEAAGLSPLQASLRYVLGIPGIARAVVGVDSLRQLEEICEAAGGEAPNVPANLFADDSDLLNPSRWSGL